MAPFRHVKDYKVLYKAGNVGNQIHGQKSVLETGDPDLGDLVLVPCDMWLTSATLHYNTARNALPDALSVKFLTVDSRGNPRQGSIIRPVVELFCIEDLEGFLRCTTADYEESMQQTKLWNIKPKYPGILQYDYIMRQTEFMNSDIVDLFMIAWEDQDILSVVPGIIEVRSRKHWFTPDQHSQNMYKSMEHINVPMASSIELPVVGMLGTILEKRLITHSYDKYCNVIEGNDQQSWFYKILLRGRRPMWFQGPVWRAPEELVLPIYLPIP